MTRALMHPGRAARPHVAAAAIVLMTGLCGPAVASSVEPIAAFGMSEPLMSSQAPAVGQTVLTPRGPAFVTGQIGSFATITLPGSGGQGLLINNANGTGTLFVPGSVPQTVITPR